MFPGAVASAQAGKLQQALWAQTPGPAGGAPGVPSDTRLRPRASRQTHTRVQRQPRVILAAHTSSFSGRWRSGGGAGAALCLLPLTGCCDWDHQSHPPLFITCVVHHLQRLVILSPPWLPDLAKHSHAPTCQIHGSSVKPTTSALAGVDHTSTAKMKGLTAIEKRREEEDRRSVKVHHANANVRKRRLRR